jgi:hypothetical protein
MRLHSIALCSDTDRLRSGARPSFLCDLRPSYWVAMTASGPKRRKRMSAPMSVIGVLSGLVLLTMSFVGRDPKPASQRW